MTRTFLCRLPRLLGPGALAALFVTAATTGCARRADTPERSAWDELESALNPSSAAAQLRRLPSAHYRAVSTFRVRPQAPPADEAAIPVAPEGVTTTTDVWMDGRGHFRLLETNDQDGGREVVFIDQDLTVALRHLLPSRRPAREPEPTRFLEEALGSPWAAWETVRHQATVRRDPDKPYRLLFARGEGTPRAAAGEGASTSPLRRWRETVVVHTLKGEAILDPKTSATLGFTLEAGFSATRAGTPVEGEIAITASVDHIGRVAALNPLDAGVLEPRQRTVIEERALLEGLAPVAREKGAR